MLIEKPLGISDADNAKWQILATTGIRAAHIQSVVSRLTGAAVAACQGDSDQFNREWLAAEDAISQLNHALKVMLAAAPVREYPRQS